MTKFFLPSERLPQELLNLRESAKTGLNPSVPDETLALLLAAVRMRAPERILEIGTAEALTSCALLLECPNARLTTVESDSDRYEKAQENLVRFGVRDRANPLFGDAAEVLEALREPFEFIFLDGPKAQYVRYLPRLKSLLAPRGVLFADDVLLYGWVNGKVPVPYKRRSIVERLREYLRAVTDDPDFITSVLEVGEGVALSVLRG